MSKHASASDRFVAHYRLGRKLGAGGMGEVFQATDTKLNREVAIKLLPEHFASDQERLSRMQREAELLASLNHPSVLTIHDTGIHEGSPYLVSELLVGQNLREHLTNWDERKAPVRKAIEYAVQISQGLSAAHGSGVIHRDLKPDNIFITKDGRAKILDFGLAKAPKPSVDHIDSVPPTATSDRWESTQSGRLLGTPAYMSPEQVRGESADHRSDIFSLGCVVYEMLSGRRPFKSETAVETMGAILNEEPSELSEIRDDLPLTLERIVSRCIEKQPEQRFQSANDLTFALENIATTSSPHTARAVPATQNNSVKQWALWAVVFLAVVVGLSGWSYWQDYSKRQSRVTPGTLRKFELYFPPNTHAWVGNGLGDLVISPDGRKFVYVNPEGLWVRRLDRLDPPVRLEASPNVRGPFWSPRSDEVAYHTDSRLYRVSIDGGKARLIASFKTGVPARDAGGSWFSDDALVFASWKSGLYQVSANGGEVTEILKLEPDERQFMSGTQLPDEQGVLFSVITETGLDRIGLWTRKGVRKTLLEEAGASFIGAVFSPSGHVLYERRDEQAGLWAFPFSASRLERTGAPFRIGEGSRPSVAADGTLMLDLTRPPLRQLVWVDRSGQIVDTVGRRIRGVGLCRISPQSDRIAVSAKGISSGWDLWMIDLNRNSTSLLCGTPDTEIDPYWYPNGDKILYRRWSANGIVRVVERSLRGEGTEAELMEYYPEQLSKSGRYVLLRNRQQTRKGYADLNSGALQFIPLPKSLARIGHPEISPNEELVAYLSEGTEDRREVCVAKFPSFKDRAIVSELGGSGQLIWSSDGSKLFYLSLDRRTLMCVTIDPQDGTRLEGPKSLFELPASIAPEFYDVAKDGRFLMVQTVAEDALKTPGALVVENWFREFEGEHGP